MKTLKQKFYEKVSIPNKNGCMEWIGCSHTDGYGTIDIRLKHKKKVILRKVILAHRLSYEIHYGRNPGDLCVCHTCDNPRCVAPEHLWLGTKKENTHDALKKNRLISSVNLKTFIGEEHGRAKLTEEQVKTIKRRLLRGEKGAPLSREYNVSETTVSQIKLKKKWKHVP